jgi:ribosomal protein S18 acetylase RimI-like enzyme
MSLTFGQMPADETLAFRQSMLWPDKPLSHVMVPGDDTALHVGAFDKTTLIGVGSFFPAAPRAQLRKLAVAPEYRTAGIGSQLVLCGARVMKSDGLSELWCDARQSACGFYEKLGFVISRDVFSKFGVAYVKAHLDLRSLNAPPAASTLG